MGYALCQSLHHQIAHSPSGVDPADIINLRARERPFVDNHGEGLQRGAGKLPGNLLFDEGLNKFAQFRRRDQSILSVLFGEPQSPPRKLFFKLGERGPNMRLLFLQKLCDFIQRQRFPGGKQKGFQFLFQISHTISFFPCQSFRNVPPVSPTTLPVSQVPKAPKTRRWFQACCRISPAHENLPSIFLKATPPPPPFSPQWK